MADPNAEHKTARVGGVDAVERLGDGLGGRRPDVDDAGGHLQRGSRLQKWLDERQLGRRRTTDPNCAVAQPFDFLGLVGGGAKSEEAKSAEVNCRGVWCGHRYCNPRVLRTYSAAGPSARLWGSLGHFPQHDWGSMNFLWIAAE